MKKFNDLKKTIISSIEKSDNLEELIGNVEIIKKELMVYYGETMEEMRELFQKTGKGDKK